MYFIKHSPCQKNILVFEIMSYKRLKYIIILITHLIIFKNYNHNKYFIKLNSADASTE